MKKLFTFLAFMAFALVIMAQAPGRMSYQALVRDSNNKLIPDANIGMQISILQGTASGTAVFVERHYPSTNSNGLVTIEISNGTVISGNFTTIDWGDGPYFIKAETDVKGGANYTITGTSQLLSVPYALYAKTAEHANNADITGDEQAFNGWDKNASNDFSGNYNDLSDKPDLSLYATKAYVDDKAPLTYAVGDFAQGGIVFWVDESGLHGLVCVKEDQSTGTVLANGTNIGISMATGDGPYAGEMNTMIIISKEDGNSFSSDAASICNKLKITENDKSYADWYLPSKEELYLMYQNKSIIDNTATANGGQKFVTGTGDRPYWSSTTVFIPIGSGLMATYYYFNDGKTGIHAISAENRVRAIRAF